MEHLESSSNKEDFLQDKHFKSSYYLEKYLKTSATKLKSPETSYLTLFAKLADKTVVSNRTVTKIATATLKHFGLVFPDNPSNVVERELQKSMQQTSDTRENIDFDRRMDQTMILSEGQFIFKQEKHVAILEES